MFYTVFMYPIFYECTVLLLKVGGPQIKFRKSKIRKFAYFNNLLDSRFFHKCGNLRICELHFIVIFISQQKLKCETHNVCMNSFDNVCTLDACKFGRSFFNKYKIKQINKIDRNF
jgi:hypothetical protein